MKELDKKSASELLSDKSTQSTMESLQDMIDRELAEALSLSNSILNIQNESTDIQNEEVQISNVQELASMIENTLNNLNIKVEDDLHVEETPVVSFVKEVGEPLEDLISEKSFTEANVASLSESLAEAYDNTFLDEESESSEEDNVFELNSRKQNNQSDGINFHVKGQTELNFNIGEHSVEMLVNDNGPLKIQISDLTITITESSSCHITSKNGIDLTIPLSIEYKQNKKKSA